MQCKIIRGGAAIVVAACIAAVSVPQARGVGYWNEPGNFCQCVGYGKGAGYHAPFILGPPEHCGWFNPHEVRLACPPGPPSYYNCGATCGCSEDDQSLLEPVTAPIAEPQPAPAWAARWSPAPR
jgi:hypothetical protein